MADRSNDDTHLAGTAAGTTGAGGGALGYRRAIASRFAAYWHAFIRLVVSLSNRSGRRNGGQPTTDSVDASPYSERYVSSAPDANHGLLGVDPELLNSERRILQLLIVEGGRLPQSQLVERTRWSDSTISRTLCRMETQGRIERFQLGSGKCVVLPQDDE
ncbi:MULTISPECIES: helix-turn-helix transcriptional regulator [Haloferax]|uniref:HTH domain protein n=1 Tax=Haloferax gibbonsii TaxID=35746 RepID=A0A871BM72_HALGI|nr:MULTISPECIES: hypothetical protein [Haloferax]QOS13869.1 HTH domain protein [Haloferax gibbonsii]